MTQESFKQKEDEIIGLEDPSVAVYREEWKRRWKLRCYVGLRAGIFTEPVDSRGSI